MGSKDTNICFIWLLLDGIVNVIYQLDWAIGFPDICYTLFIGVSVKVFSG